MWAYESVFYQIYPLGFCGAPFENDGVLTHRILKVNDWIEHIKNLGANAIYFSPVFESDTHGYNTRDYKKIDCRLGTNDDFKEVCENLHKNNIKVYGAPILPFGTSSFYSENSEKVRQLINLWMRSSESGVDGIFYFHAFYQACNALCVSGTSADKVYVFDGVSVQFELNCLRTDTSCFIYLHFKYLLFFMRVRKYLSSHGARFPDALT